MKAIKLEDIRYHEQSIIHFKYEDVPGTCCRIYYGKLDEYYTSFVIVSMCRGGSDKVDLWKDAEINPSFFGFINHDGVRSFNMCSGDDAKLDQKTLYWSYENPDIEDMGQSLIALGKLAYKINNVAG